MFESNTNWCQKLDLPLREVTVVLWCFIAMVSKHPRLCMEITTIIIVDSLVLDIY